MAYPAIPASGVSVGSSSADEVEDGSSDSVVDDFVSVSVSFSVVFGFSVVSGASVVFVDAVGLGVAKMSVTNGPPDVELGRKGDGVGPSTKIEEKSLTKLERPSELWICSMRLEISLLLISVGAATRAEETKLAG